MIDALLTAAAVLSMWLTGVAITDVLVRRRGVSVRSPAERHGLALLFGVGGIAMLLFLWSLCGGPLGRVACMALGGTGAVIGLACLLVRSGPAFDPATASAWTRCCAIVLAALWISLLGQTLLTPQRLWDERATFAIKAAVIHIDGTIQSESLTNPQFAQGHPRYPLLLPLAEAYVYGWLGEVNDRWVKVIPPLLALGLWLTYAGALSRRLGPEQGWLFTLLLATIPALTTWDYGFLCAQADAVVAAFHGVSVLYLWDALSRPIRSNSDSESPNWVLAGAAAALALFSKDEGIAFFAVDLSVCVVLLLARCWRHPDKSTATASATAAGRFALPAAALSAAWFLWRRNLPTTSEMGYLNQLSWADLRAGAETLRWSIPHLARRMFAEAFTWGLMWWGVLISAVVAPRRMFTAPQLFLLLDLAGGIAALLVAGMLAPVAVEEHLGGSSHRFLMQIAPTAVLYLAGQMSEATAPDSTAAGEAAT